MCRLLLGQSGRLSARETIGFADTHRERQVLLRSRRVKVNFFDLSVQQYRQRFESIDRFVRILEDSGIQDEEVIATLVHSLIQEAGAKLTDKMVSELSFREYFRFSRMNEQEQVKFIQDYYKAKGMTNTKALEAQLEIMVDEFESLGDDTVSTS